MLGKQVNMISINMIVRILKQMVYQIKLYSNSVDLTIDTWPRSGTVLQQINPSMDIGKRAFLNNMWEYVENASIRFGRLCKGDPMLPELPF